MTVGSEVAAFLVVFLYSNLYEYALHRWVMHKPGVVDAAYEFHTLEHHKRFGGTESTFYLSSEEDREYLFFRPWMVAAVLGGHAIVFALFEWWTGIGVVVGAMLAGIAYYGLYEYFHFTFHTKGEHALSKVRAWQALKRHHLLHHRHHHRNLNVLFPLTDVVLRTRITDDASARR